ncbi:MAG TPA: hypothetical protein VNT57_04795 [Desulfobacteria bacterium]|nr:hypothetical protein [Desulfobacteria bacterium]
MSCYLRHLKDFFEQLGLDYEKNNRKTVDAAIKTIIGKPDAHCPEIWKEVKAWREAGKEGELLEELRKRVK